MQALCLQVITTVLMEINKLIPIYLAHGTHIDEVLKPVLWYWKLLITLRHLVLSFKILFRLIKFFFLSCQTHHIDFHLNFLWYMKNSRTNLWHILLGRNISGRWFVMMKYVSSARSLVSLTLYTCSICSSWKFLSLLIIFFIGFVRSVSHPFKKLVCRGKGKEILRFSPTSEDGKENMFRLIAQSSVDPYELLWTEQD